MGTTAATTHGAPVGVAVAPAAVVGLELAEELEDFGLELLQAPTATAEATPRASRFFKRMLSPCDLDWM